MTIQPLSQYDERWKNIKLGTSNLTIGEAGCLITCCSMLASTTPDLLNKKLIEIGGYADQNLLIWAKLDEATNNKLKFNWLNYVYNNAGVKQIIADEGACIVRVDNNGIMHFVVYIGNGQMIDPLGGQVVSTSKYTPVGFADIKIDKSISDPLQECLKQHTQLVTECDLLKKQLTEKDTLISTQAKDLLSATDSLAKATEQAVEYKTKYEKADELRAKWLEAYDRANTNYESCKTDRATFQKQLTECLNKQDFTVGELLVKLWNKVKGVKI